jgi:hypothetical protein
LLWLDHLTLVGEHGVPSNDKQPREPGEVGNEILGHPVAEILLRRLATHVNKRQYGNGWLVGQRHRHERIDEELPADDPAPKDEQ